MTTIRYDHLLGVPFKHGTDDCYGLGRRFFKDNFDIDLPDFARPDEWWNDPNFNLYMDHFRELGFEAIDCLPRDIRIADVFLMAVYRDTVRRHSLENRNRVANHCAIYVGQNQILHHFIGQRSTVEHYKALWKNTTVAIIRHKDVPLIEPKTGPINYADLLPPHLRSKYEATLELLQRDQGASGVHPAG